MPARPAGQSTGWGALFTKQSIYEESATQKHRLGDRLALGDRVFYYAKAGEALVAGKFAEQAPLGGATTTLQNTCAVTVAAVAGARRIYVSALTTAQAAGLFAEGYAAVWDATTTGMTYLFRVKTNSAIAVGGVVSYIDLYDELPVALTTSDQVNLITNPFSAVVEAHTAYTGMVLGVNPISVTSGYYFWLQTYGPAGVYAIAALDLADSVSASDDTAAGAQKTASNTLKISHGYPMHIGTAGEACIVFLTVIA